MITKLIMVMTMMLLERGNTAAGSSQLLKLLFLNYSGTGDNDQTDHSNNDDDDDSGAG